MIQMMTWRRSGNPFEFFRVIFPRTFVMAGNATINTLWSCQVIFSSRPFFSCELVGRFGKFSRNHFRSCQVGNFSGSHVALLGVYLSIIIFWSCKWPNDSRNPVSDTGTGTWSFIRYQVGTVSTKSFQSFPFGYLNWNLFRLFYLIIKLNFSGDPFCFYQEIVEESLRLFQEVPVPQPFENFCFLSVNIVSSGIQSNTTR